MGVRRLFSRGGGKNFPGGARTYFLPKNNKKNTIFIKSLKTFLFLAGLALPSRRPCFDEKLVHTL
jgi:hypothetical protein